MSNKAGLIIMWRFGGKVHNDPWTLKVNGDDDQYYQIEVNGQRIKVCDKGKPLNVHPTNGGSMIPISIGTEITVVIDAKYPGEGKVRLVPMVRSGRLPAQAPTLTAKKRVQRVIKSPSTNGHPVPV